MALFGRSQRAVFKPSVYNPAKRSRRMPRWLVLLSVGITIGTGGVLFLQANYGPQRLTIEQSKTLHSDLSHANSDRQQLQAALIEAERQRDTALAAESKTLTEQTQMAQKMAVIERDMALFQSAIPPDPRGGPIGIRAADWTSAPGKLDYKVLVMNDNSGAPAFKGTMQLVIQGRYPNGRTQTVTAEPIPFNLEGYVQVAGTHDTPAGFTARQVTVRVLDTEQRQHAMRIYYVR
jgi:hypothetical protein